MARDVVAPIGIEEQLRPVAAPVNTYVRPPEPAPSNLHQLADALQNFSHNIGGLLKERNQKNDERDKYLGQKAALEANGMGYAEAVKAGKIPSYASPLFVSSFKETQGSIVGKRMANSLLDQYLNSDMRSNQDPAAVDAWIGDQIKALGLPDDPDVLKGALPYLTGTSESIYNQNAKDRNETLYNNALNASIASSSMDVDAFEDRYLTTAGPQDYDAMWAALTKNRQAAMDAGMRPEDYDKSLLAMISSKALEHNDPALLSLLSNKLPGQQFKLSDTLEGQQTINQTLSALEVQQNRIEAEQKAAQTAKDNKLKDEGTAFIINQLAENPAAQFDGAFLSQMEKVDPTIRVRIKDWAKGFSDQPEDPEEIMRLQEAILNGGGQQVILDAMGPNGVIHSQATVAQLYNLSNSVSGRDMSAVLENQAVKDSLKVIQTRFPVGDDLLAIDPSAVSPDGTAARADYLSAMYAWRKANPDATYDQIALQAQTTLKRVLSGGQEGGTDYSRPQAITDQLAGAVPADQQQPQQPGPDDRMGVNVPPPDNPLVPNQPEVEQRVNTQPKADPVVDPWRGEQPPTIDQLPEDIQQKIRVKGAEQGLTPEEVINGLWERRASFVMAPGAAGDDAGLTKPSDYLTPSMPNPPGMVERGNINLSERDANIDNGDGTNSTVATFSINEDGKEILLPTVIPDKASGGWRKVSEDEAVAYYHETGQHLGKFNTPEQADDYAEALHEDQATRFAAPGLPENSDDAPSGVVSDIQANPTADVAAATAIAGESNASYMSVANAFLDQHVDERDPASSKALSAFFRKAGLNLDPSTTAWCAAWANAVLFQSGYTGTGKLAARSFLNIGKPIDKPVPGAIVIFSRGDPNGWQGHVGFVSKVNKDGTIDVLAGNQSTKDSKGRGVTVNIQTFSTDKVLGYRLPTKEA